MFIAPIAAPPLLLALLINFLHKALFSYDWYRRLFARSFRLRVAAVEGEATSEVAAQDSVGLAAYRVWFLEDDPSKVPFIDSGLYAQVHKSLDPWLEDRSQDNALLLTGPNGAGKSSIVPRLHKELAEQHPDVQMLRLVVEDKTITADGLLALVGGALGCDLSAGPSALVREDAGRQPTLVVIDDAQNLFLRQVGGLAGWEALLGLVNARVENLFWLVLIDNHAWAYLSNVYGRDYQFRSIKVARRWSQNDIRSLVLSRNHLSGCRIATTISCWPPAGRRRQHSQRRAALLQPVVGCLSGQPGAGLAVVAALHPPGGQYRGGWPAGGSCRRRAGSVGSRPALCLRSDRHPREHEQRRAGLHHGAAGARGAPGAENTDRTWAFLSAGRIAATASSRSGIQS
ncbi:ATP-binding protein [Halopseudomonas pachastrellae]|nr:ATP-binding protein [Halopseudomonas pachastrellae]